MIKRSSLRKAKWIAPLVLLFFLVSPYLIGLSIKNHYKKSLEQLSDGFKINLRLVSYHQGWWRSQAIVATNFLLADKPIEGQLKPDNSLLIQQTIYHGPLIVLWNKFIDVKLALAYIRSSTKQAPAFANSIIYLNTAMNSRFDLDNLSINNHAGSVIYAIKGVKGSLHINKNHSRLDVKLIINHLYSNVNSPRKITHFSTSQTLTLLPSGVWVGQKSFYFGSLSWMQADKNYQFNQFDTVFLTKVENQYINLDICSKVNSFYLDNRNRGQQQISFSFSHLDPEQVKLFSFSPFNNENVYDRLRMLVARGLNFNLNSLEFNTLEGNVTAKAQVAVTPLPVQPLGDLLSSGQGRISARLPVALVKSLLAQFFQVQLASFDAKQVQLKTEQQLVNWQNQGWLRQNSQQFIINLKWLNHHFID